MERGTTLKVVAVGSHNAWTADRGFHVLSPRLTGVHWLVMGHMCLGRNRIAGYGAAHLDIHRTRYAKADCRYRLRRVPRDRSAIKHLANLPSVLVQPTRARIRYAKDGSPSNGLPPRPFALQEYDSSNGRSRSSSLPRGAVPYGARQKVFNETVELTP